MHNRPAHISICGLVNEGSLSKTVDDLRNFGMEFSAEAGLLCLVPELRFSNFKFGGATDLDDEVQ